MARQARIKDAFGTFHIRQEGGSQRKLFESDADRNVFLSTVKKAQAKFEFQLYAYCLLDDNQYHLVLRVNGSDLSKIMKSINIGYAMYARCNGKLFKDRYKSKLLETESDQIQVVQELHGNTRSSTLWNSYCAYDPEVALELDWVTRLSAGESATDCASRFLEEPLCTDCIQTVEEATSKLQRVASDLKMPIPVLLKDRPFRNQLIRDFRKQSTISLRELGMVFGGLSESSICKILNQTE